MTRTTLASTLENFGTVNDVTNLERELNQEITKVYSWLLSNKLMLNAAKSKFIIFFLNSKNRTKAKFDNCGKSY